MLPVISTLQLFETSKEDRKLFVDTLVNSLRDAEVDPLKIHLQVKAMEEIIKSLTDRSEKTNKQFTQAITYQSLLLEAAEKHGKKFQLHNAEFSIKEVGTVFDWSNCNDSELARLVQEQDSLKELIKARQDFLKTVPIAGIDIRINDELVTVYPPSKSSTTSVAVSLK